MNDFGLIGPYWSIRAALGAVLETLILLDRLLFLQEQGSSVQASMIPTVFFILHNHQSPLKARLSSFEYVSGIPLSICILLHDFRSDNCIYMQILVKKHLNVSFPGCVLHCSVFYILNIMSELTSGIYK